MNRTTGVLVAAAVLISACMRAEGIEVRDAWARESAQGANGAVYFVLVNHNPEADDLIGASSDAADAVEIHESRMEGDVMTMNLVESVRLEPSEKVEFKPGGLHVMLIGLRQDLRSGDEIQITLKFKNNPEHRLLVTVDGDSGSNSRTMENHSP